MSLQSFSLGTFLVGLAALGAALYALQRLRVRHREVVVVTTLFWKAALEESRARVLVERFRRPLVYAFLLLIASLLWLAVATPRWVDPEARERVILIDASAGMRTPGRFSAAIAAAAERAAECSPETTRVMLAGARLSTILDRNEDAAMLERRLAGREAAIHPSTLESALLELAAAAPGHGVVVEICGDSPIDARVLELLEPRLEVRRLELTAAGGSGAANRGVVALGVTEAASGRFDAVDLFVSIDGGGVATTPVATPVARRVATSGDEAGASRSVTLEALPLREGDPSNHRRFVARDLPADGSIVRVELAAGDSWVVDDVAECMLPARPRLRVALDYGVPAALRAVLEADRAVEIVAHPSGAAVVVRRGGSSFGGITPAFVLVDPGLDRPAFSMTFEFGTRGDLRRQLEELVDSLALAEIDAVSLATVAGREIRAEVRVGEPLEARSIEVWSSLFLPEYDFTTALAYPRFVSKAVRFLAGVEGFPPEIAVGRALLEPSTVDGTPFLDGERELETFGDVVVPPRVGEVSRSDGRVFRAALLDFVTTTGAHARTSELRRVARPERTLSDPTVLALGLAFVFLIVEWILLRRERIP